MENAYLPYVRQYLIDHGCEEGLRPGQKFRTRSSHIARVAMWTERLLAEGCAESAETLRLAAAFHDIGYVYGVEDHAAHSADILRVYAAERGLDAAMAERAVFLVAEHSDKEIWLKRPDAPHDLVLLMEADLLDEEGAMGIALDCLTTGAQGGGYAEAYEQMHHYEPKRLRENPMVTPLARKFWDDKQRIIRAFMDAFAFDLGVPGPDEAPECP